MPNLVDLNGEIFNIGLMSHADMESGENPDLWLHMAGGRTELVTGEKAQALYAHLRAHATQLLPTPIPTAQAGNEVERWRDAALAIFDLTEGWGRSDVQATPERLYEVRAKLINLINDLSSSC